MLFYAIYLFVIFQRLAELVLAKRNEKLLLAKGAYEVGASHYPLLICLHAAFFCSLLLEVTFFKAPGTPHLFLLVLFFFVQLLRIWCLLSLGPFWNTKIIVLPGATAIKKGPYRFLKHPNYLIVCLEILLLPLLFQAYFTAALFTILNVIVLSIRIPVEEKALLEAMGMQTKQQL